MNATHFAAWTRRRLTASLAALLALPTLPSAAKKKKKKKRCLKVRHGCAPGNTKRKCCKKLLCAEVVDESGTTCCRPVGAACQTNPECCFPANCIGNVCAA